jgi:hypothetical protein
MLEHDKILELIILMTRAVQDASQQDHPAAGGGGAVGDSKFMFRSFLV